jgi:hypothetical protein
MLKAGRRERAGLRSIRRSPSHDENREALREFSHHEMRREFWHKRLLSWAHDGWRAWGIVRKLPIFGPRRATVRFREDLKPP